MTGLIHSGLTRPSLIGSMIHKIGNGLRSLALSLGLISHTAAPGTIVGAVRNTAVGSTLSLINSAGGRFALVGSNVTVGLTAL